MKVGDLVRRTRHSHHKIGIILKDYKPIQKENSFYVHWFDLDPAEERHGWFNCGELKVINESR